MTAWHDCQYFDGRVPRARAARVRPAGPRLEIEVEGARRDCELAAVRVSPPVMGAPRFVALPDGAQLLCAEGDWLRALSAEVRSESPAAGLERRIGVALGAVILVVALLLAGYFYGLPAAAEHIVKRLPVATRAALGRGVLAQLDARGLLRPSRLSPGRRESLRAYFRHLARGLPMEAHYRLVFRRSPLFGANAFALPGGIVVLTDKLARMGEAKWVAAVMAHEIGHIEQGHGLRSVLQGSVVAALAAAVTGDAASLGAVVTGLPVVLLQARYSRRFETEADAYAHRLLQDRGISPVYLALVLDQLRASGRGRKGWLASHPPTEERMRAALRAAAEFRSAARRSAGEPRDDDPVPRRAIPAAERAKAVAALAAANGCATAKAAWQSTRGGEQVYRFECPGESMVFRCRFHGQTYVDQRGFPYNEMSSVTPCWRTE